MPCYHPLEAFYGDKGSSGKRAITFSRSGSFSGVPLRLPCGQCIGCRLKKSRQWAMRCMHEKKLHRVNCFVTLTYSDEALPVGGSLVKRDLQLFMKRLRFERGPGVRFYGCGEYGESTFRPHYHAILFNCEFPDMRKIKVAKCGEDMYFSKELEELWPYGQNVIGSVTFDSCAYVARYIMKKVTGPVAGSHYEVTDSDGVVHVRAPEFSVMSRRPGIGAGWFAKYGMHAYQLDSVVVNGKEARPPRFYDIRYEAVDSGHLAVLKVKRRRMVKPWRNSENSLERRVVSETVAAARLKLKGKVL